MEAVLLEPFEVGAVPAGRVEVDASRPVEEHALGLEGPPLAGDPTATATFAYGAGAVTTRCQGTDRSGPGSAARA